MKIIIKTERYILVSNMSSYRSKSHKSYNHVVNNLRDYMMTPMLYNKYNVVQDTRNNKSEPKTVPDKSKSHLITIKEADQLFWYFFIAKYGYDEYKFLDTQKFKKEKDIKISNIEIMKKNNAILKQNKIKISDYETDLLNSRKISISTLRGLTAYNELNIIYVKNKSYYYFNFSDTEPTIIIYNNGKSYSCDISPTKESIEMVKYKYYYIENPDKPIKGISTYKVNELIDICKKLDIPTQLESGKTKGKKQLYDELKVIL